MKKSEKRFQNIWLVVEVGVHLLSQLSVGVLKGRGGGKRGEASGLWVHNLITYESILGAWFGFGQYTFTV